MIAAVSWREPSGSTKRSARRPVRRIQTGQKTTARSGECERRTEGPRSGSAVIVLLGIFSVVSAMGGAVLLGERARTEVAAAVYYSTALLILAINGSGMPVKAR